MPVAPNPEESSLQSLARGLVEAESVEEVAGQVLRATLDLFEWDAFIFSERIEGTDEFIRVTAWDTFGGERTELDPQVHPPTPYRTVEELHRGEPLLIEAEEAARQPLNRFGDEARLSASLLFAPVRYRGMLYGICSVQSYTPRRYDRADLAKLALVCEVAAPALRRARAERELQGKMRELEEANENIGRKTVLMSAVYEIARSAHGMNSLEELFRRTHEIVAGVAKVDGFVVALCAPDGSGMQFAYNGESDDSHAAWARTSLLNRVLARREPLSLDHEGCRRVAEWPEEESGWEPPASWLGVPLVFDGTLAGAMCMEARGEAGVYGADLARMMEFVAAEVARAIVHVRAERKRREREERYRRAIASAGAVPYEREFGRDEWVHMGQGVRELLGYAPGELTTSVWRRITQETTMRGELAGVPFEEALGRVVAGRVGRWNADSLMTRKDGSRRWISDCAVLVLDEDGAPKGTLGMLQDVTERVNSLRLHEALSTLGRRLSAVETPRDVAMAAAEIMDGMFGWDAFFLDIHDGKTGLAASVVNFDVVDGERREVESPNRTPSPPSATFRWVLERGALLIRDATVSTEGRPSAVNYGDSQRLSASLMFVPVRSGDNETVGMISLQSYTPAKYSREDLDMLVLLSAQCGSALYRTLAEEASRKAQERATVFGNLAHQLGLATDARQAGKIIADAAERLLGWDACYFDLYDPATDTIAEMLNMDTVDGIRQEVIATHGHGPPTGSERRVLRNGAFIVRQDANHAADVSLKMFGDTSRPSACLMFAPARIGSQVVAFFSVQSYTPNAYDDDDLATLQALADHSAGALERIRLEEAIRVSNERYALASRAANDGLWDWDLATGRVHFSARCRDILGADASEIGGTMVDWLGRVHADDREELDRALRARMEGRTERLENEHRLRLGDGSLRWVLARAVAVRSADGAVSRLVGSLTDITARKQAEAELVESAFHDPLTGLANRALFADRLEQCFRRGQREPSVRFAVMFLDLDRFKAVNDTYGHSAGDRLLAAAGHRLRRLFRPADTVARLGGDEFTVLIEQFRCERDLAAIASRIVAELSAPFHVDGQVLRISASVGIATSEHGYAAADEILRDADAALYRAKELGKSRYEIFDRSMRESIMATVEIESGIRDALARGEFALHYQPIYDVATGAVSGFEALLRWNHPTRGLVGPAEFVPVAEDSALIDEIGAWAMNEACRRMAQWRRDYAAARDCYVSVNVSARQFSSPGLAELAEDCLGRHGLGGDALHVEITETALLKEPANAKAVLERWRRAGVRVALDDFGTGCSSLSHLNHFSVDYLKIDRAFVSGLGETPESQRVVRAVISLASVLGIRVVAEGAETREQCELLRDMRCDLVQGYFLSRPLPPEQAERLLAVGAATRRGGKQ